jgi:outer membrane protein OmpA-like peptidoglycan-associated protein
LAVGALLALAAGACAASRSNAMFTDPSFAVANYRCVVVAPFENQSRTEGAGFAVADFMANALSGSERFKVVDRKVVQSILDNPGVADYAMDPGRAVDLGRTLNADAVIIGAVNDYWYRTIDGKPEVSLSMRIVDVKAERVVYVANGSYQPTFFTRRPYLLTAASKEVADALMAPVTANIPMRSLADVACGVTPAVARPAPAKPVAKRPAVAVAVAPPPVLPPVIEPEAPAPARPPEPASAPVSAPVAAPAVAFAPPPAPPPPSLTPGALALLRRMANNKTFVLEGVDFDLDKTSLKGEDYKTALENLGIALREKPALRIRIESHTDGLGDPQFNLKLTELRAQALKSFLATNFAIAPDRIEAVGYGGERPMLPNINRKNREANRRVELTVVEGP